MRHNKKHGMKLGTDASHTKAMRRSLVRALFENDRIKTNVQRAKAIRPDVDRIITWAKKGDLHSRRLAIAQLADADLVGEVFDKAAQGMWADRNGGYTRIMRIGYRKGDNAEMAIIELVNERVKGAAAATATETVVAPVEEEPEPEAEVTEVEEVAEEADAPAEEETDFEEPEAAAEESEEKDAE